MLGGTWTRLSQSVVGRDFKSPTIGPLAASVISASLLFVIWLGNFASRVKVIETAWGYFSIGLVGATLLAIGWARPIARNLVPRLNEWRDRIVDGPIERIPRRFREFGERMAEGMHGNLLAIQGIAKLLQYLIFLPDFFLVRIIAPLVGMTLQSPFWRYGIFLGALGASVTIAWVEPQPFAAWGLFAGYAIVLAVFRRWQWTELDRQMFVVNPGSRHFRILDANRANQDLSDEALTGLTFLLALLPLTLRQAHLAFGLFAVPPGSGFRDWLGFVGGELAKAAPFVDWAEVYGVSSASSIRTNGVDSLHVVFAMRALFDVVLIASGLQGAQILRTISDQRRLLKERDRRLVDPFLERDELLRIKYFVGEGDRMLNYEPTRIKAILERHEDRNMRAGAASLAGKHEEKSGFVDLLIQKLADDEYVLVRMNAAEALGLIGDLRAVLPLLAALKSNDDARYYVVQALGRLKDPRAVEPISGIARDQDMRIGERRAAILALRDLGGSNAVATLIELLTDEYWGIRMWAAQALGSLRDASAVPALIDRLVDEDEDEDVRAVAAEALGKIGGPAAREALQRVAENDPSRYVQAVAKDAIARMNDAHPQAMRLAAPRRRGWLSRSYQLRSAGRRR